MKTIAIFSGYALPHLGGIERYVENLSQQLRNRGYRVIIISSNYNGFKTIEEKNNIMNLRLPIYKLFSRRYPIIKHHHKDYKKILSILDKSNIDRIIVNTRFHLTSLMGARYGKKHHIPVYLIEHGSAHLSINNKVLDFFGAIYEHCLTKILETKVDKNYGVSVAATDWQKHFGIISDGIWYNSVNPFDQKIKINKSKKYVTFLYAGRVLKQKGIEDLITSFNFLNQKYKNIQLIIAGEGDYLPYLKKEYSNNKNIQFLGRIDFDEVVKLYASSHVFVHPSNYPEGLPTCILEAGLMKCAVIATPNGGTRSFINKNNGIIISDNKKLTKAMKKCIDDEKYRKFIGNNLQKTVLEKFTWEKATQKIIEDMEI